jgi:hypothetical protein
MAPIVKDLVRDGVTFVEIQFHGQARRFGFRSPARRLAASHAVDSIVGNRSAYRRAADVDCRHSARDRVVEARSSKGIPLRSRVRGGALGGACYHPVISRPA